MDSLNKNMKYVASYTPPVRDFTIVTARRGDSNLEIEGFERGNRMRLVVRDDHDEVLLAHLAEENLQLGIGPYAEINLTAEMNDMVIDPGENGLEVGEGYPSPFNPTLTIPFKIHRRGAVKIMVYDVLGQVVVSNNQTYSAGSHRFEFNATSIGYDLASGVYLITISHNSQTVVKKAILLK
ncbi:T9SS type A sorting domain-containing protein [bacterium]|nr:T9SS type A sorting domain-containing protein [bacterium]